MVYQHDNIQGIAVDTYSQGSFGNDTLIGTDQRDMVVGLGGRDIITGGKGADILYGGMRTNLVGDGDPPRYNGDGANDIFVFHNGDSGVGGGNRDIVRGFDVGVDKIDLTSFGPDLRLAIYTINGKHLINIDADNNGKWDMQISVVESADGNPIQQDFSMADILLA